MWVYILTGVTFVTSLAMLGILIYSLVELGRISSKRKSKDEEMKKEHEKLKKKMEAMKNLEREIAEIKRIQSYVDYCKRTKALYGKEWDIDKMTEEEFRASFPLMASRECPKEVVDYNKKKD